MKAIDLEKDFNHKFDGCKQLSSEENACFYEFSTFFCKKNDISYEKFNQDVWSACRYIFSTLEGRNLIPISESKLKEIDLWIYSCLETAKKNFVFSVSEKDFFKAESVLRDYFFNNFVGFYVEAVKLSFWHGDADEKDRAVSVLLLILEESLRLLYPYSPIVAEQVYSKLPLVEMTLKEDSLVSAFPLQNEKRKNEQILNTFNVLRKFIDSIQIFRADCGIDPVAKLHTAIIFQPDFSADVLMQRIDLVQILSGIRKMDFVSERPEKTIGAKLDGFYFYVFVDEGINKEQVVAKLSKEIKIESAFVQKSEAKLNSNFVQNAPAQVVQDLRVKVDAKKIRIEKLQSFINEL